MHYVVQFPWREKQVGSHRKKKKKSCKSAFYISFLGKVERQITEAGNNRSSRAVEALLEAIKLSQRHDQKLE